MVGQVTVRDGSPVKDGVVIFIKVVFVGHLGF